MDQDQKSVMTSAQRGHINIIMRRVNAALFQKYEAGQRKHGGNLWDKSAIELLDEAINEVLDQAVYLYTLRDKLTAALADPELDHRRIASDP